MEIDHEIISTVILLPSAESFMKGCCQLQAKVCARLLVNCFFKLAQEKSVVRWTDRPAMTIAVDLGRKATKQTRNPIIPRVQNTKKYPCADPKRFVRGVQHWRFLFVFSLWGEGGSKYHYKRAILNGVSLACRWWPNIECRLGRFMIFQWIRTSIAKKPCIFVNFKGGPDPLSPLWIRTWYQHYIYEWERTQNDVTQKPS